MSHRRQSDPVLIPGKGVSGGAITLRLFVVLALVFGAGLAIALATA